MYCYHASPRIGQKPRSPRSIAKEPVSDISGGALVADGAPNPIPGHGEVAVVVGGDEEVVGGRSCRPQGEQAGDGAEDCEGGSQLKARRREGIYFRPACFAEVTLACFLSTLGQACCIREDKRWFVWSEEICLDGAPHGRSLVDRNQIRHPEEEHSSEENSLFRAAATQGC